MDYQDGSQVLEVAVAFPLRQERAPAVLVVHQWSGRGEDEHRAAERLAELGFVGIATDVYGKGVSRNPAGDNSALMAPWMSDRAALLTRMTAALTFARQLDRVDASAVGAIGYCFGGLCVLAIAEELDRAEERSASRFELEAAAISHFHSLLQAGCETWH
jgi:dienelactone hydrolase